MTCFNNSINRIEVDAHAVLIKSVEEMMQNGSGSYMNQQTLPPATHYSIDVECVATGRDHNARTVAQISLVVRALGASQLCRRLLLFDAEVSIRIHDCFGSFCLTLINAAE